MFVGVMLAFFVSSWRSNQIDNTRAIRTLRILESELADFTTYGPHANARILAVLDTFEQKLEAGKFPVPAYYREPRASTSPVEAWKAVAQSGAYELLDDSLFYAMSLHYNRIVHFNAQYMRYTLETEDIVMPYIDGPAQFFYEPGSSILRSEYRWHVRQLEEVSEELTLLLAEAAELQEKLRKQIK